MPVPTATHIVPFHAIPLHWFNELLTPTQLLFPSDEYAILVVPEPPAIVKFLGNVIVFGND